MVAQGQYRRFDNPSELPSALSRIAGFPDPEQYRTCVVMASATSQAPPSIDGLMPATSAPIYRVCAVRLDQHAEDEELHFNKDDVLLFNDRQSRSWQLYAKDQPGHYEQLSNDSGLGTVLDVYRWPKEAAGSLNAIEAHGGLVDFSTG